MHIAIYHPGSDIHGQLCRLHKARVGCGGGLIRWHSPGERAHLRSLTPVFTAATSLVMWLCACVRYWPYRETEELVVYPSILTLALLS